MPSNRRLQLSLALVFLAVFAYGVLVAFQPILYTALGAALVATVLVVRWAVREVA